MVYIAGEPPNHSEKVVDLPYQLYVTSLRHETITFCGSTLLLANGSVRGTQEVEISRGFFRT